jgi:hypothetical protein
MGDINPVHLVAGHTDRFLFTTEQQKAQASNCKKVAFQAHRFPPFNA